MNFKDMFYNFVLPPVLTSLVAFCFVAGLSIYNKAEAYTNNTVKLYVPYTFLNKDKQNWDNLENTILNSQETNIVLYWQGIGGRTNIGWKFIKTIQKATQRGKKITFDLVGTSWSEHANVACFAPNVIEHPRSELDFHASWDVEERHYTNDYYGVQEEYTYFNQCISKGFLTSYARDKIIKEHKAVRYKNGNLTVFHEYGRR